MANYVEPVSNYYINRECYQYNSRITTVDLQNIPFSGRSMYAAFQLCTNLTEITNMNENVVNMSLTFASCTNLTTTPTIPNSVNQMRFTFQRCGKLTNTPVIPNSVTSIVGVFTGCTNLTTTPIIPDSVTDASGCISGCRQFFSPTAFPVIPPTVQKFANMFEDMGGSLTDVPQWCMDIFTNCSPTVQQSMEYMFSGWKSLVNAPVIPSSVVSMYSTFFYCNALVNAPVIPNSVTNMFGTFQGCFNLVTPPDIPNGVLNMNCTFSNCSNLATAPNIPVSVTSLGSGNYGTFEGCVNLTGNVYIHSTEIVGRASETVSNVFKGTSAMKNVYIPYYYANNEHTRTYNSFTTGGYDELGTKQGVYLKDLATL